MSLGTPKFKRKKARNRSNFLTKKGSMVGRLIYAVPASPTDAGGQFSCSLQGALPGKLAGILRDFPGPTDKGSKISQKGYHLGECVCVFDGFSGFDVSSHFQSQQTTAPYIGKFLMGMAKMGLESKCTTASQQQSVAIF